jgi:hypothetical protein
VCCSFCSTALAQESEESHPFLTDRFQLAVGVFARHQNFKLRADGILPEDEIDFDQALGVDDDERSGSFTFRWNFGEKWSLWGQAWKVDASGGQELTEDIEWENIVFREGSFVKAGIENTVARVFLGRRVHTGPRHEFGLGAGFHWLEIKAFIEGRAQLNKFELGFVRDEVNADSPLPNIGAWYYFSPAKRWLIEARLDWLDASVGDYSGSLWNSSVGVNVQAFRNVGIGLAYQAFSVDVEVDNNDWRGGAELNYKGPFLSLTANW